MSLEPLRLRRYSTPVIDLAAHWFDNPIQTIDVSLDGDFTPTADGACRVRFSGNDIGFVKPRPGNINPQVIGNEKIASDLGRLLHLPVAPVVVRRQQTGWLQMTAMSLVCLNQGRHWGSGPTNPTDDLFGCLEALRVFWTWIGDIDHNSHPENLLYEFDGREFKLTAIDHSYAFGHGGADALTAPASVGYAPAGTKNQTESRAVAIAAIEQLDGSRVEHIIMRLVGEVLTSTDARAKLDWLGTRRGQLSRLVGV